MPAGSGMPLLLLAWACNAYTPFTSSWVLQSLLFITGVGQGSPPSRCIFGALYSYKPIYLVRLIMPIRTLPVRPSSDMSALRSHINCRYFLLLRESFIMRTLYDFVAIVALFMPFVSYCAFAGSVVKTIIAFIYFPCSQ